MKSKFLYIIIVGLLAASCGSKTILDENHSFANNCWMRFEPVEFTIPKVNPDKAYRICLTLSYDTTRLSGLELPLLIKFYADSNERHTIIPDLQLRDAKGLLRGSTIGQYCTVTDTIDHYRRFNQAAPYTYSIKQRTSKYELYGISCLQLKVESL